MGPSGRHLLPQQRTFEIPDYRLEKPAFTVPQIRKGEGVVTKSPALNAPAPPIRDSKYLYRQQCIEIYRWMLLNRRMERRWRISTSRAKSSAAFISVSARKPVPAPQPTLSADDWLGAHDSQPGCDAGARL